jgi:hypothetical protein
MGRKSKIQKEIEEKQKELEAIIEADRILKEETKNNIDNLVLSKKLFCGVILGKEELITIIRLFIEKNEPVKIEYQLYKIEED